MSKSELQGISLGDSGSMDEMKRLWMVNHYAIGPDMPGGSRHHELSEEIVKHGWNTTIFATPFSHKTSEMIRRVSLISPFRSELSNGTEFRWIYSTFYERNNWRRYLNMLSFTLMSLPGSIGQPKPDVVLGSSPHLLAAFAAWLLALRHRTPFVFEVRDLWPDTLVEMGLNNPAIVKPLAALERFLYEQADLIPVLTEGIGEAIKRKGVPSQKILFVPNASKKPDPLDPALRDRMRERLGWRDCVVAIYAGAHGPANDLGVLVQAAEKLEAASKVKIVFVGDGPSKKELVNQALGLARVEFLDSVPKSEVAAILRAADIGILSLKPTKVFEGARPNKLFDYMANGLPVISTIGGEAAAVLENAGAGFHVPAKDLANALLRLESDEAKRKLLGHRGFQHVSNTLTREQTAKILAERLGHLLIHRRA